MFKFYKSNRTLGLIVIAHQNPVGRTIKIIVLAMAQRPKKGRKAYGAKEQRNRDQDAKYLHASIIRT